MSFLAYNVVIVVMLARVTVAGVTGLIYHHKGFLCPLDVRGIQSHVDPKTISAVDSAVASRTAAAGVRLTKHVKPTNMACSEGAITVTVQARSL